MQTSRNPDPERRMNWRRISWGSTLQTLTSISLRIKAPMSTMRTHPKQNVPRWAGEMTFYEQELRKLFADGTVIGSPKFTGRACLGTLGKDLRVRVQFVTSGHADHYDAISITVLNRTDGVVDKLRLRLKDVLGVKQVPGNPNFRSGVLPYIWDDYGKVEWYAFRPPLRITQPCGGP